MLYRFALLAGLVVFVGALASVAMAGDELAATAEDTCVPVPASEVHLGMSEAAVAEKLGRDADNQEIASLEIQGQQYELRTLKWWIGAGLDVILSVDLIGDVVIGLHLTDADEGPFLPPVRSVRGTLGQRDFGSNLTLPQARKKGRTVAVFWGPGRRGVRKTPLFSIPDGVCWRCRWASYDPEHLSSGPSMFLNALKWNPNTGTESPFDMTVVGNFGNQEGKKSGIYDVPRSWAGGTFRLRIGSQLPWLLVVEMLPSLAGADYDPR